jgi:ABC-type multidrug transport system ATPase subunit
MTPAVMVTGGAGFVGSHVCKALAQGGLQPVVYDNLSRGHRWAVQWGPLVEGDLADAARLEQAMREYRPLAVMHFASSIEAGLSVEDPATFYANNICNTLALLQAMRNHSIDRIVFSSSAAVYGDPLTLPMGENHPRNPVNPYGVTKNLCEVMLSDFAAAYGLPLGRRDRVIADVLALTDMDGRKDHLIQGLSRGMQQRVSLARVLVNDPDLLLLDEPASGLDPRARIELMEILRELRRMGKTIFISSHILSELAELCDSVTIIDRGRIKFSGTMRDLVTGGGNSRPMYQLTLAADFPGAGEKLARLPGVAEVVREDGGPVYRLTLDDLEAPDTNTLLRGVIDLGLPIASFTESKRHLNQAFMDLTEQGVR